jgi:hypothetical protein
MWDNAQIFPEQRSQLAAAEKSAEATSQALRSV